MSFDDSSVAGVLVFPSLQVDCETLDLSLFDARLPPSVVDEDAQLWL